MEDKSVKDIIKKEIHLKLNQIELTEDLYNLLSENNIQHTSDKNGIFFPNFFDKYKENVQIGEKVIFVI